MKVYVVVKYKYASIKCLFRSVRSEATMLFVFVFNVFLLVNIGFFGDVCLSVSNSVVRML